MRLESTGDRRRMGTRWSSRAGWRAMALVVALTFVAAISGPAGSASGQLLLEQGAAESSLTWSVRPSPTDAEPDRPNFVYDLDPGTRIDDSIRVRNFGDAALPLTIYASDALTTSSGALDLLPAGEEPADLGKWIVLEVTTIDVPPGGFVDVPFTLVVPANAESGDHSGGIVTSYRSPSTDDAGQPVVVDRRLGSRVHVRVGGELSPSLSVTDVSASYSGTANPIGTGTLRVGYTVENTGNVRLGAEQVVVIPARFGLPGREVRLEQMGELLPGNSLTFTVDLPNVWPSFRTTARVEVTPIPTRPGDVFDEPDTASASETTWAVPWTAVGIVCSLVAVALWAIWARRRRGRQATDQMQQAIQTAVMVQAAVQAALDGPRDQQLPEPDPAKQLMIPSARPLQIEAPQQYEVGDNKGPSL